MSVCLTGACACGHTRYSSLAQPIDAAYCHCLTCQRSAGATAMAFMSLPMSAVSWPNEPSFVVASDTAQRKACGKCGSWMVMNYTATPELTYLAMSSVDFTDMSESDVARFKPSHHIFTSQRAAWSRITDGLPQFPRFKSDGHKDSKL